MSLRKDKKKAAEASVAEKRTPYEIGLNGSVEDFYAAVDAAEVDIVVKRVAAQKSQEKRYNVIFDGGKKGRKKYLADQRACAEAKEFPDQIRKDFLRGACEAFDERPDNIQHILSAPGDFLPPYRKERELVTSTLIALLDKSDSPDSVPDIALEKVAEDEKKSILNRTLFVLVRDHGDSERYVFALLEAGADASYQKSKILALALHNKAPAAVADMLIDSGANLDDALQTMRDNCGYYGDTPEKIEAVEYRKKTDARIEDLERMLAEATKDHTGRKPKEPDAAEAAPPAPAATTARHTKILVRPN